MNDVCIFHIGRSGSTVLCNLLDEDGRFDWYGEIFEKYVVGPFELRHHEAGNLPNLRDAQAQAELINKYREEIPNSWRVILSKLFEYRPPKEGRILGIEMKFFHLALSQTMMSDFLQEIKEFGFSKILVLQRKNYLRKVISSVIFHEDGVLTKNSSEEVSLKKIYLDVNRVAIDRCPQSLLDHFRLFDERFLCLERELAGQSFLWLTYEDHIVDDPLVGYRHVCDFLGLETKDLRPSTKRMNPYSVSEMLVNFDEVSDYLKGTSYEWMLSQ